MPRSAKLDDETDTIHETPAKPGLNGYDGPKLQSFIDRWESVQGEIDEIMDNARDAAEPHRQDQAAIVKEAAEAGFSKKEFKAILRKRRLEDKLQHVADSLDSDQKETYEAMLAALGELAETPLGRAALNGH